MRNPSLFAPSSITLAPLRSRSIHLPSARGLFSHIPYLKSKRNFLQNLCIIGVSIHARRVLTALLAFLQCEDVLD